MHGPDSDAGLHNGREDEEEQVARAFARGTLAEYLERRPSANEGDDDRSDDEASIESLRDVMVDVVLCQGSTVCGKRRNEMVSSSQDPTRYERRPYSKTLGVFMQRTCRARR